MAIGDYSNPTWTPGETLTAAKMQTITNKIDELDQYLIPRIVLKDGDEVVNNSTTLQNDNALVISLEASKVFEVECILFVNGPINADIKTAWVAGGGLTILSKRLCIGGSASNGGAFQAVDKINLAGYTELTDQAAYCAGDATDKTIIMEKMLVQTSTAGTLQLQWAQIGAVATNTTVFAGSYIKATLIKSF